MRKPWVQTLHSLDDHPALAEERRRWQRLGPRIRSATAVIVATDHARDGVIDLMDLDPGRVHVVPFGVSPAFRLAAPAPTVDTPYLLYVGEYGPHKGYREAFESISGLAERGFPHRLEVAGRLAPWHQEEVTRLLAVTKHPERVDLLGHVDQARLVDLYAGATAVVMTSRCEAFGFPLVEAMAMAIPVVAFDNTAIPSVLGDGGVTVPDGDVGAVVDAVAEIITDPAFRNRVAVAARRRSVLFDWQDCAAAHKRIYAAAAEG
jgi:glycosyltransferase involved in cell wall biosynthesis